jgi:hypothetical protein
MNTNTVAQRVEWLTSVAVIVTLVVLILEVRGNTRALERQLVLDAAAQLSEPFLAGPELLEAYEHVKAVDGWEPLHTALVDQYGMTNTQAVAWGRYLLMLWQGLEANYVYSGESEQLTARIQGLMTYPDDRLYWKIVRDANDRLLSPEFVAYVDRVAPVE